MKTISKRFLKASVAMLLVVMMLFSSTISGFAAVVDNADTKANVDVAEVGSKTYVAGEYLYFKNSYVYGWNNTLWVVSGMYLWAHLWKDGSSAVDIRMDLYTGTANTEGAIYRCKIPSAVTYDYVIFSRSTSSTSNNWAWGQSYNVSLDSSYNTYYNTYGNGNGTTTSKARTASAPASCTATVTNAISGSGTSSDPYLVYAGDTFTVQVKATKDDAGNEGFGYNINSNTSKAGNNTTGTWTKDYTASTTVNSTSTYIGYAWCYEYSTDFYSTNYKASSTIYVKTVAKGYSYTVTAGAGGSITSTPTNGTASSVTVTASPSTGYEFAGWETTNGSVNDPDALTTTFTPSKNNANAHATFKLKEYKLTINESGATGGTFTVDGDAFTSDSNVTHGTHTLGVTAPAGYKITSINGGTANPATINVTAATTINVVYEVDNKCSTSFADTSTMNLVLGGEGTRTATLSHCTSGGTVNYSSSDTTVATVDANGKVKALKAGTTTITAECSKGDEGSSATYTVKVNNPTFSVANVTVDVNGTVTAVPTITANEPAGTYSYEFTSHSSNNGYYAVNETTGVITGQKPTTSCLVSVALVYNNTNVATASFSVKVNEPEVSLNKTTLNLLTGQTAKLSVTSTPDDYESVAYSVDSVVTVGTDGTVSTTASTGTGNVTATVKYNDYYSKDLTCSVTVASPTLTVSPATLNLEIGGGTTTGTVTVTNNDTAGADGTDAVAPTLEVTSSKPDVATATVADGEINVTAKALGTTTLTVSYRNVTKTVTVNVSQYDPYAYIYVTDSFNWGTMYIYGWNGSSDVVIPKETPMIYIGRNNQDQRIFAYRILKTDLPEKAIFKKGTDWGYQSTDTVLTDAAVQAYYFNSSTWAMEPWNIDLVRPTVSVDDLTVVMGETGTAEATVTNGDKVVWTIDDTATATVANVTTKTATVTSVAPGTTEISARAFIDTTKSSIVELPNNYATDTACWPYISTVATATVTVDPGSARQITVAPSYSNNGTDYSAGVTGGTVNATYETQSGTSIEVPYNGVYTLTADPADGYAFNGWTKNNVAIEGGATLTVTAKESANYVAKFIKTYSVTVATSAGVDTIKINNAPGTTHTAKAGETIEVYASPADGYRFVNWTVTGTATVTNADTATVTISNIQSNISATPSTAEIFSVNYTQYVNRVNATVGTVTVNGKSDNGQTFDKGTEVTLVASSTTRAFYGWYASTDTNFENPLSTDATYVIDSLDENIDVIAMFYRPFTIEGEVPGATVELDYDIENDTYTGTSNGYTGNAFTVKDTFGVTVSAADVNVTGGTHTGATVTGNANGYTLVPDTENYNVEAPITYTMRHMGTGTYYLDIALSDAEKVAVKVNGTKVADKAIGSTFSYEIAAPAGQYLSNATTSPAVDFEIVDGAIKFTVPDTDINIVPEFADYSYVELSDNTGITATGLKTGYKAGEAVEITLSPASEATTITSVVAKMGGAEYGGANITQNGDNWTIAIASMPADTTITLETTVDAKFVMNYGTQVAIGNYGTGVTSGFGTVSMKIGNTTLANGGYAGPTDTVTYTATASNANYVFAGFYSDAACENVLSYDLTYEVKPTKDTTVYTLWARRQYMDFDSGTTNIVKELTYDKEERIYTLSTVLADNSSSSAISKGAWFQVTNDQNSWTAQPSYHHYGSDFTVTHNGKSFDATISWNDGGDSWKLTASAANDTAIKFILTPTGNTAIDFSAQVGEIGDYIYLSSGRLDLPGSYNSAVFEVTTNFTTEGIDNPTDVYVANEGENREKYKRVSISDPQVVSWETEITGTSAPNYEIESYVVYFIDTKTYEIVTPVSHGSNKFSGSVYVDGPCYIVPVYFMTSEYAEANNLAEIDIYFEASAIHDQNWGPFVACYAWGSNNTEYHGGWSGQMMIPTADGKSFYTMLTVPKSGDTNATSIPNGVTFNNYMQSTVPGSNAGAFGLSATQYQCYDYREPITLYECGYDVITFVAKDSTDGYHGDRANGVTANTVTSSTTDIFNKYDFDYLYSRDGVTPMDLNGNIIENPVDLSTGAKADYYIVNKGDITYDPNGTKYVGDNAYDADWSVDWYIFDSNGNFITNILSTAMWHDKDKNLETIETYLHDALGVTAAEVAGKTVAISYEHENNADHQVSYDGQWYGNMLDDTVNGQVKVGFQNGDVITIDDDDTPNVADYGSGYILDENGNLYQSLDVSLDYGVADLHAVRAEGYVFVGWFTQLADGTYKLISKAYDCNPNLNLDETYYAIFRDVAEGEVVINHAKYVNSDPAIPSHDGMAEMSIVVTDKNGNEISATPSTSRTSVSFEGSEELGPYTIQIITTPLLNGEFFAWYTDSTNADGTKTYEEVFTDGASIGSTTKVVAEFEYAYSSDSQKVISIYSDVKRVSNTATLTYKYFNRFGQLRTYTVKNVPLSDDECFGFAGNGGKAYYPAYLTEYTFDVDGNEVKAYEDTAEYEQYIAAGYDVVDTYNKISAYCPKADVTEVFNGTVEWVLDDEHLTYEKSLATLSATQGTPQFTINYEMAGQNGSKTDYYNELIKLTAPTTYEGNEFSYWYEPATGEILTYSQSYNYRIVENKTIKAVYGVTNEQDWTPSINSVTTTREFGDGGDYIYTDYLLAYNNVDGKELNVVKDAEEIRYGLLVVRDSAYYYEGEGDPTFPNATAISEKLKLVASNGKSGAFTVDSTKYNCYCYDLTEYDLTNFNRCDYIRKYDNNAVVGGTHSYKEYAFTAVAYIIVDGVVYLSAPEYVNFYDLGITAPTN